MTVTDIVLFTIVGALIALCVGGWAYCEWIEPLRVKLALAKHFPMYETERNAFIENSKIIKKKLSKVQKVQKTIDRLGEETKYLTGTDLLIIENVIEELKKEYAEVNADYLLSKKTFEDYVQMFYALYPFAHPYDFSDTPLEKEKILYKNIKNSLDN